MRTALFLLLLLATFSPAVAGDVADLTRDVETISSPGVPGPLCVLSPNALPVVVDARGEPVVAAAAWGKGQVVVYGHGGFLGRGALAEGDTFRLVLNTVRWCAGRKAERARVGVVAAPDLRRRLGEEGLAVGEVTGSIEKALPGLDVIVVDSHRLRDEKTRSALRQFVKAGGGLVTAGLGWGWRQLNPGRDLLREHPGNLLLAGTGLVFADGTVKDSAKHGFLVKGPPPPECSAARALDLLSTGRKLRKEAALRAQAVLVRAVRHLSPDEDHLRPLLSGLLRKRKDADLPGPRRKLDYREGLARVLLAWELTGIPWGRPREIRAHPAAEAFPGPVDRTARRVSAKVTVDLAVPGWTSTGLYAPPGETVTAKLPTAAATLGLRLRIGCHKDLLWGKDSWSRVPEITRSFALDRRETVVATPFGGLVYVEVPRGGEGRVEVRIDGAVRAPRFVLGRTDPGEWKTDLRHLPAPWAELETSKVVITVPASHVRDIEDPRALLELWDRILDAAADLAVRPRERARPERYVADVQISAGYMHAGYPIMTHLDAAARMVDPNALAGKGGKAPWGLYHELGHNHQERDWTFDGAGEVTVNLFSLYLCEKICGLAEGHGAMEAGKARTRLRKYLSNGARFADWQKDPFLALTMYDQLRREFGWETYKKVFAEYRNLPASERPKNDAEKRDQWLVRFSRAAGRDLGPFFGRWGVPVSEEAKRAVAGLPRWMPEGLDEGD